MFPGPQSQDEPAEVQEIQGFQGKQVSRAFYAVIHCISNRSGKSLN